MHQPPEEETFTDECGKAMKTDTVQSYNMRMGNWSNSKLTDESMYIQANNLALSSAQTANSE
jgi:hypothetical protein